MVVTPVPNENPDVVAGAVCAGLVPRACPKPWVTVVVLVWVGMPKLMPLNLDGPLNPTMLPAVVVGWLAPNNVTVAGVAPNDGVTLAGVVLSDGNALT